MAGQPGNDYVMSMRTSLDRVDAIWCPVSGSIDIVKRCERVLLDPQTLGRETLIAREIWFFYLTDHPKCAGFTGVLDGHAETVLSP